MSKTTVLVSELSQIIGISGDEKAVSNYMVEQMRPYCDEIVYDNLGSVFAVKKSENPNAKKVMVCAHMDESGLMITEIHKNGLASFITMGHAEEKYFAAARVRVKTREGEILGTIVCKPGASVKEMYIDLGTTTDVETRKLGVMEGDSAVLDGSFAELGERWVSKALDNRAGCAMAIEILEAVKDLKFDFDLYIGAVVMEEVGQRGATSATGLIHPDLGMVIGCHGADDLAGKSNSVGQLGKGLLACIYDKGMMPNRGLLYAWTDLCTEKKIPFQYYYSMTTNEGAWIHKLFAGCPTLNVSVPVRNEFSANVVMDSNDYECAKNASVLFLQGLNEEKIQEYKESNR